MEHIDTVIIGGGLTGLTLAYKLKKAGKKVLLLEKSARLGGVIDTECENGFVYEKGPNTGVLSSIELIDLFEDLKDDCKLELANPQSKKRWILYKNIPMPLPSGLVDAVKTPLFPLKDKLRILGEPFRKKGNNPDETLAELVKRRLGKSYLNYAVDPFVSGIYAGDPEKLITRFAMPKLYNLEQRYGSFIKGALQKRNAHKINNEKKITKEIFSAKGGLRNFTDSIAKNIGAESYSLHCQNIKIYNEKGNYKITFLTQNIEKEFVAKKVVCTVGAYNLNDLLPFVDKYLMEKITNINYAKVIQVSVGFDKWEGIPLKAFGLLIPTVEKRDILGILFPSSIFENRTPSGGALLSVFMGGMKNKEIFEKSDKQIKEIVKNNIVDILKVGNYNPSLIKIFRYPHAIAQYEITSEERLNAIQQIENQYNGLYIAGNLRGGISMSDRVKQAVNIFNAIIGKTETEF